MNDHRYWTHRLSEYVDGDMTPADRVAFEAHVASCADCASAVSELRMLVGEAAELGPIVPPRDLWPAIERSLSRPSVVGSRSETRVIALPTARATVPRRRAFTLSPAQLAAAAAVIALVSTTVTMALGPIAAGPATGTVPSAIRAVSSGPSAPSLRVAAEVAALEEGLLAARNRLDPNTVRIIEKNLAVIERAIAESRQALEVDPESDFLRDHLDRAFTRKRDYLREATELLEWAG